MFDAVIKVLSGIAIFQSIFISIYLFTQKKGTKTKRYLLGILLITFAIFLIGTYIILYEHSMDLKYWGHIFNLSVFLIAPLLYFYFNSYLTDKFKFDKKKLVHFLPFGIILPIMIYKVIILERTDFLFDPYGIFLLSSLFVQNIIYLFIILSRLKSNPNYKKRLNWFDFILKSFILVFITKLIIFILWNVFDETSICIYFTNIFFVLSFIVANTLVFYGLHKPDLLIGNIKYQHTPIDPKLKDDYIASLNNVITSEELFVDPLISLDKVAKKIKISSKHLSQLLNETYNQNFNEYINQFRIEKAKNLLLNDAKKDKNILEIAYEVGFNSKTTFNTAFKKFTGKTPSEYRN